MLELYSILSIMFAIVVIIINIITQLVKSYTYKWIPTRILAMLLGIVLFIVLVIAGTDIYGYTLKWYYIVGGGVLGIIAAYCSSFGYDEYYTQIAALFKNILGIICTKK